MKRFSDLCPFIVALAVRTIHLILSWGVVPNWYPAALGYQQLAFDLFPTFGSW
jgi:hypothetical protein